MLLNHPFPYPDEALSCWVWRLAQRNYVPSPTAFLSRLHAIPASLTWNELREPKVFRALAALTNTSVATIHAHTLHRFAPLLTAPEAQTLPLPVSADSLLTLLPERLNHDFYTPTFAWCPACLAEAHYVRLHWHVPFMVCCTVHECWMLDACPNCQMRLREPDILAGRCADCGTSLERAAAIPVPNVDLLLGLQTALLGWLYRPEVPQSSFPDIPVAVLLRVLRGLRYSAQRAGNGWDFHYIPSGISKPTVDILKHRWLTLFERGCLYATAVRGLQEWPQSFYNFLDAYRQRPAPKEATGLRREFGTLYISWLNQFWKHPAFSFVQHAFNDYLVEHIPVHQIANSTRIRDYPDLLERVDYVDLKRTAKYLGSSVKSVYRLVEEGHLTAHRFPKDVLGVWFARHELERCKQTWEQHLPFAAVARQLGLSKRLTGELLNAHLLRRVSVQGGLKQQGIFVEHDSLQTLLSSLKSLTTIQPASEQGISLLLVCIRNGSVKMDLTHVLTRLLAGKLPAYHPNELLLPLSALWFMPQDVEALATHVKANPTGLPKKRFVYIWALAGRSCILYSSVVCCIQS